ncbi:MAG: nuclear transport factor 2 family protein [Flavisolibacter sp.]
MKKILLLFLPIAFFSAHAQDKKEKELIERTYLLSHTVFGSKDSVTVEDLFAKKASYGHSGGKIQTREEAVDGIVHNKSTYSDTAVSNIRVIIDDDVAIVRHLFHATEKAADGKTTPLNFTIMLVWVREKGKWRLLGRQAVKI